jgi:hypothetical protein
MDAIKSAEGVGANLKANAGNEFADASRAPATFGSCDWFLVFLGRFFGDLSFFHFRCQN